MTAMVDNDRDVVLTWSQGYDDHTPSEHLVYRVFIGSGEAPVHIGKELVTTLPGQTSTVVKGLTPGDYRFVVRAIDNGGNMEENRHAVTAAIRDLDPPVFDGVTGVVPRSVSSAVVEWKPATDNFTPPERIRYQVFASDDPEGIFDRETFVTQPGVASYIVAMNPGTPALWVGVRAVDEVGNVESNGRITSTRAPENVPPVFSGLTSVVPDGTRVTLKWSPAIDNATAASEMVYRVFSAKESGDYNLLAPTALTKSGATQYTLTDLEPETEYFFIVQAQDLAGNRDSNINERAATTGLADVTAPTFEGVLDAVSETPRSITVSWNAASDDRTISDDMAYDVFLATNAEAQDFDEPFMRTKPGRSSAVLLGLAPGTEYFVVVRAIDESGNSDDNAEEISVTTRELGEDSVAPSLQGTLLITQVPSKPAWLKVEWSSVLDDVSPADKIRGHLCVAETARECQDEAFFERVNQSSALGSRSVFVTGLASRRPYWVALRLEDENGNLMSDGPLSSGTTATSFADDVQPLLDGRCNQCHTYSYGTLVNVPSGYEALYLVNPVSVVNSYLVRTLREDGSTTPPFSSEAPALHGLDRMPSDGTNYLIDAEESILLDWITQGAFDD